MDQFRIHQECDHIKQDLGPFGLRLWRFLGLVELLLFVFTWLLVRAASNVYIGAKAGLRLIGSATFNLPGRYSQSYSKRAIYSIHLA